jgi:hypothetical protein
MHKPPIITPVRELLVDGRTYQVQQAIYGDDEPEYLVILPNGEPFEDEEPFRTPPTDKDIIDIAGVYISEYLPEIKAHAADLASRAPDEPQGYDMYGGI